MVNEKDNTPQTPVEAAALFTDILARLRSLEEKNAELQARIDTAEEAVEEALTNLGKAKAAAPATPTPGLKGHIFKLGKESFRLRYPFVNVNGKSVSEEDLLLDGDLQKQLLKENPNLFVPA